MGVDPVSLPLPSCRCETLTEYDTHTGKSNVFEISVELPDVAKLAGNVDLDFEEGDVCVSARGYAELRVALPPTADDDKLSCKFDIASRTLKIRVPVEEVTKGTNQVITKAEGEAQPESENGADKADKAAAEALEQAAAKAKAKAEAAAKAQAAAEASANAAAEAKARELETIKMQEAEKQKEVARARRAEVEHAVAEARAKAEAEKPKTKLVTKWVRMPDPNKDGMVIEEMIEEEVQLDAQGQPIVKKKKGKGGKSKVNKGFFNKR